MTKEYRLNCVTAQTMRKHLKHVLTDNDLMNTIGYAIVKEERIEVGEDDYFSEEFKFFQFGEVRYWVQCSEPIFKREYSIVCNIISYLEEHDVKGLWQDAVANNTTEDSLSDYTEQMAEYYYNKLSEMSLSIIEHGYSTFYVHKDEDMTI